MKLEEALEIGKECGLTTIEECVLNIEIHAPNLFAYTEIDKELRELYDEVFFIKRCLKWVGQVEVN
jgi:hypothetical protein